MQKYLLANKRLREVMRICTLQLLLAMIVCGISLAHPNYAQQVLNREITVSLTDVSIEKALLEIEVIAKVKFVYSHERLKLDETISLKAEKKKLGELLTDLLTPRGIEFTGNDESNFVVLKPGKVKDSKKNGKRTSDVDDEQNIGSKESTYAVITGIVTDGSTDMPLPGVNVIVKGTTNGTNTDSQGQYTITAEINDILIFSFIGFTTREVLVGGKTTVDIVLQEDAARLNEVIVKAGYWEVKEKENTGNIAQVKAEDIQKQPVTNPLLALQGRMPGVYIQENSGIPGGRVSIQIRGQNSLRNSINDNGNLPFFIVDGVPFPQTGLSSGSLMMNDGNPLASINPSDIESIEVLKDGDATAIYGSRGANGVVLITTKKGKAGKTNVELNVSTGVGKVGSNMEMMNTQQYLEMRKEAYANAGRPIPDNFQTYDLTTWDSTRYTDWQKVLIGNTAKQTNSQLTLSGGSANTNFLLSGGFFSQGSVFPGDAVFERGNVRLNLNHISENKKLHASVSANYVTSVNDLNADFTFTALSMPPNAPALYDTNGNLNWENSTFSNPLATLESKYKNNSDNLLADASISYELLSGLNLKATMGYNSLQVREISTNPISSNDPAYAMYYTGSSVFANGYVKTWIAEPQLNYSRTFGEGNLNVLIGTTFQDSERQGQTIQATGYTSDALIENILAAAERNVINADYSKYRYMAVFSRIHYNWKGKHIINVTGRRDGSSRFGPGKQFGNFGAIGYAWIFTNENFLKGMLPVISFGKLRTSYGITGSDAIGNYQYLDSYSSTTYPYNGSPGLFLTRHQNTDYSWEANKKLEAALEIGLFEDRVFLGISWYRNRSSNQLVGLPLPLLTGQSSVQFNFPATVENRGWEFQLGSTNIKTTNFTWRTNINLTIPRNELIEFDNLESFPAYKDRYEVGKSIYIRRTLKFNGVDPQTGVYSFEDFNGDGAISLANDGMFLKEVSQRHYGGINNSFQFRNFQLDFNFQFVKQTGNSYTRGFSYPAVGAINQPVEVYDRWQNEGDIRPIQKYSVVTSPVGRAYSNYNSSDAAIVDASFVRLKTVSLVWNIPSKWAQKVGLGWSKIYVNGQNLLTLTDFRGMDPENQNPQALPPLRMITFGIQLSL